MSPKQIERKAAVALVAMYRSYRREGLSQLTRAEVAGGMGPSTAHFEDAVVAFMVDSAWVKVDAGDFELTAIGRAKAEQIISA